MGLTLWGHTKNPRRVRWSWYIPDRRTPPALSKDNIYEGYRTRHECSELILHGVLVVRAFAAERFGGAEVLITVLRSQTIRYGVFHRLMIDNPADHYQESIMV